LSDAYQICFPIFCQPVTGESPIHSINLKITHDLWTPNRQFLSRNWQSSEIPAKLRQRNTGKVCLSHERLFTYVIKHFHLANMLLNLYSAGVQSLKNLLVRLHHITCNYNPLNFRCAFVESK
jgi:hypothetical protein